MRQAQNYREVFNWGCQVEIRQGNRTRKRINANNALIWYEKTTESFRNLQVGMSDLLAQNIGDWR